jgi:hypothetical protein
MRIHIDNGAVDLRDELTLYARRAAAVPVAWRVLPLAAGCWLDVEMNPLELEISWNGGMTGMKTALTSLRERFTVEPQHGAFRMRHAGRTRRRGEIEVESRVRVRGGIVCGLRANGALLVRERPIAFRQRITTRLGDSLAAAITRGAIEGEPVDAASVLQELSPIPLRDTTVTLRGSLEHGYFLREE